MSCAVATGGGDGLKTGLKLLYHLFIAFLASFWCMLRTFFHLYLEDWEVKYESCYAPAILSWVMFFGLSKL
ncbi:hypothetical protein AAHA92_15765 [Salvia divinorum]|uniref:Uncharacterized protein n=1 Tax=Salvia divinorum TaxID=28513 RepID=A0ABD1HFV2_SALDI